MKALLLLSLAPFALIAPAAAQSHQDMPGMTMPQALAPVVAPDPHTDHQPADDATAEPPKSGTDLPPGNASAPPISGDRSADRYFDPAAMEEAEGRLMGDHGGMTFRRLLFNLAEYQVRDGRDRYRWDAEFWIGGDINRLVVKSEGEGEWRGRVGNAEVQGLFSRAIDPYWNVQVGVRQDVRPSPGRTYAVVGIEGVAPYWIELDGALFLSDKGDLLARVDAHYDQRITESVVLQPRAELNFAAQDVPANGIGSGLSDVELGLRVRYEKVREFAPYVGISWERKLGNTADFARTRGEGTGGFSLVAGIRTWF